MNIFAYTPQAVMEYGRFVLRLEYQTTCPVCGSVATHTSSGFELSERMIKGLANHVKWLVSAVAAQKPCYACGVVSDVPKTNKDKLFASLTTNLTTEVLKQVVVRSGAQAVVGYGRSPDDREFEYDTWKHGKETLLERVII